MTSASRFSRIPDEILALIFKEVALDAEEYLFCLPTPRGSKPENKCKILTTTIYAINAVSSRWRHVALHTPLVWTVITTPFKRRGKRRHPTRLLLSRSARQPLAVFDAGQFPLQTLSTSLSEYDALGRVVQLHLTELDDQRCEILMKIPFTGLQDLQIDRTERNGRHLLVASLSALLRLHQNLRSLTLDWVTSLPYQETRGIPPVALRRLKSLTLTYLRDSVVGSISRLISAPNLQELKIKPIMFDKDIAADGKVAFDIETSRSVRKLLLGGELERWFLEPLLFDLPNLQTLQFASVFEAPAYKLYDVINSLCPTEQTAECLVPQLRTLSIHNMRLQRTALQRVLDARAGLPQAIFRTLQLSQSPILDGKIVSSLPLHLHGVVFEAWEPGLTELCF